jgi:hypothetical protein
MFKTSGKEKQIDLFSGISGMLKGKTYDFYKDPQSWHNMFREQVVNRVNEGLFKVLYNDKMGAPNSSIKILSGMMALKEGFGWSDSELFQNCRFNLLIKSALGLYNISDDIPAESTYYLLRRRIHAYQQETGIDLIEQVFRQITALQVEEFNVEGRSIRMDSKLIGSNIAWSSRYELVHNTLTLFYRSLDKSLLSKLGQFEQNHLKKLTLTKGNKIVFRSTRDEIKQQLSELGILCYKILLVYTAKDSKHYETLKKIFYDQFYLDGEDKIPVMKENKEIRSASVQSPYDTDCAYRDKDGTKVKGYSINVTETCDDNSLNLITDIQIGKANKPDTEFVKPAIDSTSELLGHAPENMHADGAFQSPENVDYCDEENISCYFTGFQGAPGRYDLTMQEGQITVTDTQTGETLPVHITSSGKCRITTGIGYRYFSQKEIDACQMRKEIARMPMDKRNKRNNVEATIFQLCFHSRNNKTVYRGMIKHRFWAFLRSIWINLRRIMHYLKQVPEKTGIMNVNFSKILEASIKNLIIELKSLIEKIFSSELIKFGYSMKKLQKIGLLDQFKKIYFLQ